MDALDEERTQQAAVSQQVASQFNPDAYAKAIDEARARGVPAHVIAANPEPYLRPSKYGALMDANEAPTTQAWLANVDNAAVAQDDVETLSMFERTVNLYKKRVKQSVDVARALPAGAYEAFGSTLSGAGRLYQTADRLTQRGMRAVGLDWLVDATTFEAPWYATPGGVLRMAGDSTKAAGDLIGPAEQDQNLATDISKGLGQVSMQIGGLLLTGGTSSTSMLFAQGADIMGERAEAAGATEEQLDVATLAGAGITAVTERYGLDALLKRVAPGVRNAILAKLYDVAIAGGTEALQEVTEGVLHNLTAAAVFDPNAPILEGLEHDALAAGGTGAVARAILNAIVPGRAMDTASRNRETAEQLHALAQQSKLAQRSPEKFEEFVASLKEDGVDTVYIDPQAFRTLFQSDQEAAQAAADLTGSSTTYFEAAVSSSRIAIPVEKYVARLATNKKAESLLDHIAFTADGLTAAEAKESKEGMDAEAKKIAEKEAAEVRPDTSQAVYDDVVGQLLATGMEQSTAEKNATLMQVVFRTLGQRTGMDPQALYERYGLRVQRDIPGTSGTSYDQPLTIEVNRKRYPITNSKGQPVAEKPEQQRNFWRWFAGSKVVDGEGHPLVVYHGTKGDFDTFDPETFNSRTQGPEGSRDAFFFTIDPDSAESYAFDSSNGESGSIMPVYLRLKNPAQLSKSPTAEQIVAAKAAGHDGIITPYEYAVFDPSQIKSATGNHGTFDPHSPNILEQRYDETKRGAIQFGADRQFTISLLEKADLSTFLHESGHFYLEILADLAEDANAPAQVKEDFASVLKWMGVKSRAEIGVDQHEQWARGFEAYLMEGKAPSVEVQSVFARFRAWLVAVYRSITRLNVNLTDDVRGVMDRLVATDEEIDAAEESQNYVPIFTSAADAGMSPEEWDAYRGIVAKAHQEAVEELTDRALKQLTREQKAWWKEERAKMRASVEAEVNAMPVYRAIAFLQKGQTPDGQKVEGVEPVKLNRKALEDRYGKDFLKRLPRGVTAKDGINPDIASSMWEFDSADALVEALANARPKTQLIEMEADARMREKYGDMLNDGTLADQAMQSVHTDARAKVMAAELRALNRKRREVQQFARATEKSKTREAKQAREANEASLPDQDELRAIKAAVGRIMQAKKVRDIQPNLYRVAEAKAARKAFELAGKGKFDEAYAEKRRQILNHELYRAAVKAREEIDGIVEYMRSFDEKSARQRLGKAGGQFLAQIDAIRARFDFSNVSNIEDLKRTALLEWVDEQRKLGMEVSIPNHVLDEARRTPYKTLTLVELQGLHDAVKNIDHLSRLKNKLLASAKKRDFDETVDDVVASIDANHTRKEEPVDFAPRFGEKLKKGVKRYFAEHTKMEFLFSWLDGEKDLGSTWEALFKPLADAENAEQAKMREAREALRSILGRYSKSELSGLFTHKIYVPEVKASFTRSSLLAVALNAGNQYNRDVLLRGYGWSEAQLTAILAKLDNRDWDTVEAIWDHINTYWTEIAQLQKDLTGLEPEKVAAEPFITPTGRQVKGGYYPLKYDSETSERQSQQDEAQSVTEMFGGNFARIATRQGHTKARTDSAGKKVKLDLGVYTEHVTNVIHDLSFRRAVLDVDRLIQDSRIESAIVQTAGREMYRQLRPWLRNIAADYRQPMNTVESILNHARAGASIVSMGFKITTAIVQPLGYLQTVEMLGAKYAGIGLKEFYGKGTPMAMARAKDFVFERSEQMRNRMTTFDRDVRDQLKNLEDRSAKVRRSFFFMTGAMDMAVSIPSWLGAYRKAMDGAVEGVKAGDENAAIDFADSTVRKSQSAGGAKDLAGIQAGHPLFKLFTTFYSYFNVMYNLMARRVGMTKSVADIPRLVSSAMLLWFVPAVLGELLTQRGPGDDEEPEDWFVNNWKLWATYPLQGLIGFREIVQAMGPYGYDGPPALDAIAQTGTALNIPEKILDDEQDVSRSDVKAAVLAVSYWGHLPGRQGWITGSYLYDYMTGEVDEFSVRDALFAR